MLQHPNPRRVNHLSDQRRLGERSLKYYIEITNNFTQSAEGHKDGLWTTVLSAAVMIL